MRGGGGGVNVQIYPIFQISIGTQNIVINKNFFWLQEEPRKGALTNTDLIPSLKRIIAETKNIAKSYKRETR